MSAYPGPSPSDLQQPAAATSAVPPADIVVFGGTGDLAMRKLLPALYLRDRDGQLPPQTRIIATSRAGLDEAGYRDKIRGELSRFVVAGELDATVLDRFLPRLTHVSLDIDTAPAHVGDGWAALAAELPDAERVRVFYLAIAPALFGTVSATARPSTAWSPPSRALVLEKPIGHDLASAPRDQRRRRRGASPRSRSSASTTTWARRRCRT